MHRRLPTILEPMGRLAVMLARVLLIVQVGEVSREGLLHAAEDAFMARSAVLTASLRTVIPFRAPCCLANLVLAVMIICRPGIHAD